MKCSEKSTTGTYKHQVITKSPSKQSRPSDSYETDEESEPEIVFDDNSDDDVDYDEDSDIDETDLFTDIIHDELPDTTPLNPGLYILYEYTNAKY